MLASTGIRKCMASLRTFLIPCVPETLDGIKVERWVGRALDNLSELGRTSGFLFKTPNGKKPTLSGLEADFLAVLLGL